MSDAVNLRIDPRTGVKNWTTGNITDVLTVAEFAELPGVYGIILTQVPHPTDIEVYLTSDPSVPLTRTRKITEPASDEFWSDSDKLKPRGYIIVNSIHDGASLTAVYKGGGYLAHKRVLEEVIPVGPPGPAGGVDSVFGRSGDVTAQSGDYNLDQISDGTTNKGYTSTEKTKLAGIESGATNTAPVPAGTVIMFAGSSAPTGYIACDGASLLRAGTYASLFSAIGTTYGSVDGTHFNVPDMRGLFVRGSGAHGTMTKAAGGAFDGGSVGATSNDMFQGHYHTLQKNDVGGETTSLQRSGATGSTSAGYVFDPITDGTNGTPRTGNETKPASISLLYCIKY